MKTTKGVPKSILLFFIDGVGLGDTNEENPLVSASMPNFRNLLGGIPMTLDALQKQQGEAFLGALDASLGVEGLPQSATGQASLLTGQNISKLLGRHWPGLPTKTIQQRLLKFSIFKTLRRQGRRGFFANFFDSGYFEGAKKRRFPHSATTWSIIAAEIPVVQSEKKFNEGQAVFHDLTGKGLIDRGVEITPITPQEAGQRLGNIANSYDVTLYEYFLTDWAGHQQNPNESKRVFGDVDEALGGILETYDTTKNLLLIVSDHGNVEDIKTKSHTLNPVPLLAFGPGAADIVKKTKNLTDLAPYLRWWGKQRE